VAALAAARQDAEALRAFVAAGEVERWIADQRWEPIPGGWRVRERLQGWRWPWRPRGWPARLLNR